MYRIAQGSTHNLADVEDFIRTLNEIESHPLAEVRTLFDRSAELFITRAPGRLDVMGGIADYSGSLVLQMPIREAALVALQKDEKRSLRIVSLRAGENGQQSTSFEMPLADFEHEGRANDYSTARAYFQQEPSQHWAAYAAGAFLVLMRECGFYFSEGARVLISSSVPEGKGVSSSAAIEVAVMQAIAAAFDVQVEARELSLLCQKVENLVVGAPCGVMDQMTAACGEAHRLLALLCQPAELQESVSIPQGLEVWGIDSGIRHSVSGADYGSVRVGAFMGYRIIAELAGLAVEESSSGQQVRIHDERWGGYLANLMPSEFEQFYAARLPERVMGGEFLARYKGTTDDVTRIEAARSYAVRVPTAHPIYEHFRVRAFAQILGGKMDESGLALLGELMYQSHASYSACGLGSQGTDLLVQFVRDAGPEAGLYGAKITGGGSGGSVAVLGRSDAASSVAKIADRYAQETGRKPLIFKGSSTGAAAFGYLKLKGM